MIDLEVLWQICLENKEVLFGLFLLSIFLVYLLLLFKKIIVRLILLALIFALPIAFILKMYMAKGQ